MIFGDVLNAVGLFNIVGEKQMNKMAKQCKWCGMVFKQDVCHGCGAILREGNEVNEKSKKAEYAQDAGKKNKRSIGNV